MSIFSEKKKYTLTQAKKLSQEELPPGLPAKKPTKNLEALLKSRQHAAKSVLHKMSITPKIKSQYKSNLSDNELSEKNNNHTITHLCEQLLNDSALIKNNSRVVLAESDQINHPVIVIADTSFSSQKITALGDSALIVDALTQDWYFPNLPDKKAARLNRPKPTDVQLNERKKLSGLSVVKNIRPYLDLEALLESRKQAAIKALQHLKDLKMRTLSNIPSCTSASMHSCQQMAIDCHAFLSKEKEISATGHIERLHGMHNLYHHVITIITDKKLLDQSNIKIEALGETAIVIEGCTADWWFPNLSDELAKKHHVSNEASSPQLEQRQELRTNTLKIFKPKLQSLIVQYPKDFNIPLSGMTGWVADRNPGLHSKVIAKAMASYHKHKQFVQLLRDTPEVKLRSKTLMNRCQKQGDVLVLSFRKTLHNAVILFNSQAGRPSYLSFGKYSTYAEYGCIGWDEALLNDMYAFRDALHEEEIVPLEGMNTQAMMAVWQSKGQAKNYQILSNNCSALTKDLILAGCPDFVKKKKLKYDKKWQMPKNTYHLAIEVKEHMSRFSRL